MDRTAFIHSLDQFKQELSASSVELDDIYVRSEQVNPWFIKSFQKASVDAILDQFIDSEKCKLWFEDYPNQNDSPKRVGLIMAGNIPLVGFHDVFCTLAAGHRVMIKLSDKDPYLLPFILDQWKKVLPIIGEQITYVAKLDQIDSVIATGSNNSGRYFEYYFRQYPHVFRQNRNGVAVLTGNESISDLKKLAEDIFMFFGLGCRNVSKIYVPQGYDFSNWDEVISDWKYLGDHNKYRHNLDYNFAIYLVNQVPHIHLGHLILKEDEAITSRIGCLHYSFYDEAKQVEEEISRHRDQIQCVVSENKMAGWDHIRFGETQHPSLNQYADGVDTMQFLTSLN